MVSYKKDESGYIVGFVEWAIVNSDGQFEENGKYIYIQDIWIKPSHRKTIVLKELATQIYRHQFSQKSSHVYWEIYRNSKAKKIIDFNKEEWIHENKRVYQKDFVYKRLSQVQVPRQFMSK